MTSQAHMRCFVLVLQIFLHKDVSLTQQRTATPEKVQHNSSQSKRQTEVDQAQTNRLQVSPMLNHTACQPQSPPSPHNTFHFVLIASRDVAYCWYAGGMAWTGCQNKVCNN